MQWLAAIMLLRSTSTLMICLAAAAVDWQKQESLCAPYT
jgi:hypothetical protein